MLVFEFKLVATKRQYQAIDEAIRTGQFIRNKCLRYWLDASSEEKVNGYTLNKYTKALADNPDYPFVAVLNSMARQANAERAWASISRFYDNCKQKIPVKKGFPRFKKFSRSIEYKTSGWKLSDDRKYLTITDKTNIAKLKLIGTRDLSFYSKKLIKRIRLIRRADGYSAQFCLDFKREEILPYRGEIAAIDVGLESYYTDQNGNKVENPRFLRKSLKKLKRLQRRLSRKKKGSKRRNKQRIKVARQHLKVSRQRKDFAIKTAKALIHSNDVVVYEELKVKNMVKNRKLALSISDVSWSIFTDWLDYFGKIHGRFVYAIPPHYTSQICSSCGEIVKKSLSVRTHICSCGFVTCCDQNAALNLLDKYLKDTAGRAEINHAQGQMTHCLTGENLLDKVAG